MKSPNFDLSLLEQGRIVFVTWINEPNWPVVNVTSNIENIVGYSAEDFIERRIEYKDLVYKDDLPRIMAEMNAAIAGGSTSEFTHLSYRLVHKSGQIHFIYDHTRIIRDSAGKITHFVGYLFDETELQTQKQRLELVLRGTGLGMWDWNPQTNDVVFDEGWANMLGYDLDEIDASLDSWSSRVHPDDSQSCFDDIQKHMQGETDSYQNVHRMQHRDGHWLYIWDRGKIVEWDAEGKPVRFTGTHTDITDRKEREIQLTDALQRHRTLLEIATDGIHIVDRQGKLLEFSESFARMLGYEPDELSEMNVMDWDIGLPKEDIATVLGQLIDHPQTFETKHLCKDGSHIDVEINIKGITLDGEVCAYASSCDITERKKAQKELSDNASRLRQAQKIAHLGSWELDLQSNKLIWSDEVYRIFEYEHSREPASFERFVERIHPDDRQAVIDAYQNSVATATNYEIGHRLLMPDGRIKYVHERCDNQRDRKGKVIRSVGTVLDITDQKLVSQALQLSELRFQMAMDATDDGVWDWDLTSNEVYFSPRYKSMLGYQESELEDHLDTWKSLVHPDMLNPTLAVAEQVVKGETDRFEVDFKMRHKQGHWVDILSRARVITDENNKPVRLIGTHINITERKQVERELLAARNAAIQASQAKTDFLANMSHEIRTPMNSVIGMTNLLLDTNLDSEQRLRLETVKSSADALLTIINDILDFSKIEAGKLELELGTFELGEFLATFAQSFSLQMQAKGLEFVCPAQAISEHWYHGDSSRLRQVLINLVGNALKFTQHGEIIVNVVITPETENVDSVTFRISDTGIGIAKDYCQRLFERFSQADSSTTRNFGGTGLGLAISQQIIELMQGEIGVESELGEGSTFWFKIPMQRAAAEQRQAVESEQTTHVKIFPQFKARVLVVEDNVVNQMVARGLLEKYGLSVDIVGDGLEAINIISEINYDLIFMDIQMPVMDGYVATGHIRKRTDAKSQIPVIALTANVMGPDIEHSKQAGMNDHLAKPIDMQRLEELLIRWLPESSRQDAEH